MERYFNTEGLCRPQRHYMVNLDSRLKQIQKYIERGQYFVINRGRQYGKTTLLAAIKDYFQKDYLVLSMDFQFLDTSDYETAAAFVSAFGQELLTLDPKEYEISDSARKQLEQISFGDRNFRRLASLFRWLSGWCAQASRPVILMIDEVDSASNNQVFLDFLAQLRGYYLSRDSRPTFQSVILAGVHDIRSLKLKIRPESEHRHNSPWNIASEFDVNMDFTIEDICGMLEDYEKDRKTGMDIRGISQLIYDYTSGYPVLVSTLCKIMDERLPETDLFPDLTSAWTKAGLLEAVKILLEKKMPLFESLIDKLEDNEKLRELIRTLLFDGQRISFNIYDEVIGSAAMYGFIKNKASAAVISNRIFEITLYEWFLSLDMTSSRLNDLASSDKSQFIRDGRLDLERVLAKFTDHFNEIYGSQPPAFLEKDGRRLFLLYLRPIINGIGNYYIEAQTRDQSRMDIVIDYRGEQFVIELKIWHGQEYLEKGEEQIAAYLDYFHLDKGYLASFNFNKNKKPGLCSRIIQGKTLVEAVV